MRPTVTAPNAACMAIFCLLTGCATSGASKKYFLEDSYARYYTTGFDKVLRVEADGTVLDVTCLPLDASKLNMPRQSLPKGLCPLGKIPELGKVQKVGKDWDMSAYVIEPESGNCKPLPLLGPSSQIFNINDWDESNSARRSCWNRLWEVPTAIVLYPTLVGIFLGIVTSPIWVPILFL